MGYVFFTNIVEIFDEVLQHVPWHQFSRVSVAAVISKVTSLSFENAEKSVFRHLRNFTACSGRAFSRSFPQGQLQVSLDVDLRALCGPMLGIEELCMMVFVFSNELKDINQCWEGCLGKFQGPRFHAPLKVGFRSCLISWPNSRIQLE